MSFHHLSLIFPTLPPDYLQPFLSPLITVISEQLNQRVKPLQRDMIGLLHIIFKKYEGRVNEVLALISVDELVN